MKKILKIGIFLLVFVAALGPSQVKAFNSATHIYIADHVFPFAFDKIDLYYGSIAPDLSMYLPPQGYWPDAFWDTHHSEIFLPFAWWRLDQRAFAKGWQTHNEEWGADFYAHETFPNYDGYVVKQAKIIAGIYPFLYDSPDYTLAHFAVEVAIDLLLVKNQDSSLGGKLLGAALLRSSEDLNLLGKTFVSDDNPSLLTLSGGESNFRNLVIEYATALTLPDPLRMEALGALGVQISGGLLDSQTVQTILLTAMHLCSDHNSYYMVPINAAISGISHHPGLIR
jgi:hypothetical protein